jgi:hypothetical protein
MPSSESVYYAYLLRLRYLDNGGHPLWVYSLESPDGNERHEFRTLPALMAFIDRQTLPCGRICRWQQTDVCGSCSNHDKSPD